jgi:hypothetical protein
MMVAFGAAISTSLRLPQWSRSSWVITIQRRSRGSTSDHSAFSKFPRSMASPVSTRIGWRAEIRYALTGSSPSAPSGRCEGRVWMSDVAR